MKRRPPDAKQAEALAETAVRTFGLAMFEGLHLPEHVFIGTL